MWWITLQFIIIVLTIFCCFNKTQWPEAIYIGNALFRIIIPEQESLAARGIGPNMVAIAGSQESTSSTANTKQRVDCKRGEAQSLPNPPWWSSFSTAPPPKDSKTSPKHHHELGTKSSKPPEPVGEHFLCKPSQVSGRIVLIGFWPSPLWAAPFPNQGPGLCNSEES